ncbi:helix-turn-helix domain-containing protein [Balneola sp. MJW-20]|uniref:helix-turn-helix domain-containing protein n=1 Tax=Gracilimonas aurantiaca TaxID=3234185 RepID=UPI003466259D
MEKKIKNAIDLVRENLSEIHNVAEWSDEMGYKKPRNFSEDFNDCFGEKPLKVLVKLKLAKAINMLQKDPDILHYQVARAIGLANEQSLYKFIKHHTGKPPTHFKKKKQVS